MTENKNHSFTVVPDEHAKQIAEKGITINLNQKKDAEKTVATNKG